MKKALYVLVLIIGATAIFVLATLPAQTVFGWFSTEQVRAFGIEGNIWRGSAKTLVVGQTQFSPVTWKFTPSTLFGLRLGFQVDAQQGDGFVWTRVELSPRGKVALKDLQAALPVDSLSKTLRLSGLGGELDAHMTEILLDTGWPSRVDGRVQIKRLRVDIYYANLLGRRTGRAIPPQNELLGGYVLTFADQRGDPLFGQIEDLDGPLEVAGTLTLNRDRSYLVEGLIGTRPGASSELGKVLGLLGPAEDGGGHRVSLEGSF